MKEGGREKSMRSREKEGDILFCVLNLHEEGRKREEEGLRESSLVLPLLHASSIIAARALEGTTSPTNVTTGNLLIYN